MREITAPRQTLSLHCTNDRWEEAAARTVHINRHANLMPRDTRCRIGAGASVLHPRLISGISEATVDLWRNTLRI